MTTVVPRTMLKCHGTVRTLIRYPPVVNLIPTTSTTSHCTHPLTSVYLLSIFQSPQPSFLALARCSTRQQRRHRRHSIKRTYDNSPYIIIHCLCGQHTMWNCNQDRVPQSESLRARSQDRQRRNPCRFCTLIWINRPFHRVIWYKYRPVEVVSRCKRPSRR